jgi:GAF domain-containing protein
MNDLTKSSPRKPDVPEEIQARWQRILDLMAKILSVPGSVITKADAPQIEVFLSSVTEGNPFRRGDRLRLDSGLYCERVMRERAPLLVPDALKDPEWEHNPMVRLGVTYYLGFPLLWSDGEVFGSICIFDRKDNPQATQFQEWVSQIRQIIEKDLCTLVEIGEREDLLAELQRHRDHLQEMVAEQIAELEKSKEILEERLRFEDLVSDLSASFVNVPPDRVEDEIARALNEICRFFKADH